MNIGTGHSPNGSHIPQDLSQKLYGILLIPIISSTLNNMLFHPSLFFKWIREVLYFLEIVTGS